MEYAKLCVRPSLKAATAPMIAIEMRTMIIAYSTNPCPLRVLIIRFKPNRLPRDLLANPPVLSTAYDPAPLVKVDPILLNTL